MKVQLKTLLVFAFVFVSAAVIGDTSLASADPLPADPSQSPNNGPLPPQLSGSLKFQLANKALGSAGLPPLKVTPPAAQMKVSVVAPTNNGATIAYMGPGAWVAPYSGNPEGSFQLTPKQVSTNSTDYYPAHVDMRFPAEVGKLYLVDCKITNVVVAGQQVQFWNQAAPGQPTGPKSLVAEESGHALYTYQARQANESVSIATSNNLHFSFHSCEITKIN